MVVPSNPPNEGLLWMKEGDLFRKRLVALGSNNVVTFKSAGGWSKRSVTCDVAKSLVQVIPAEKAVTPAASPTTGEKQKGGVEQQSYFRLIASGVTLNLRARDEEEREVWVDYFKAIQKAAKRKPQTEEETYPYGRPPPSAAAQFQQKLLQKWLQKREERKSSVAPGGTTSPTPEAKKTLSMADLAKREAKKVNSGILVPDKTVTFDAAEFRAIRSPPPCDDEDEDEDEMLEGERNPLSHKESVVLSSEVVTHDENGAKEKEGPPPEIKISPPSDEEEEDWWEAVASAIGKTAEPFGGDPFLARLKDMAAQNKQCLGLERGPDCEEPFLGSFFAASVLPIASSELCADVLMPSRNARHTGTLVASRRMLGALNGLLVRVIRGPSELRRLRYEYEDDEAEWAHMTFGPLHVTITMQETPESDPLNASANKFTDISDSFCQLDTVIQIPYHAIEFLEPRLLASAPTAASVFRGGVQQQQSCIMIVVYQWHQPTASGSPQLDPRGVSPSIAAEARSKRRARIQLSSFSNRSSSTKAVELVFRSPAERKVAMQQLHLKMAAVRAAFRDGVGDAETLRAAAAVQLSDEEQRLLQCPAAPHMIGLEEAEPMVMRAGSDDASLQNYASKLSQLDADEHCHQLVQQFLAASRSSY